MEYMMQKTALIAVGIVIALIVISAVLLVFDQIVSIYTTVDKIDVSIVNIKDEYAKYDGNIMRGVEILNTIKLYKRDKDVMIVRFNLTVNGGFIRLDNNSNWDTYINYFNGANATYQNALSYTYTTRYTMLPEIGKVQIDFSRM